MTTIERDALAERIGAQMSDTQVCALARVAGRHPVILRSARSLRRLDLIDDEHAVQGVHRGDLTPLGRRVLDWCAAHDRPDTGPGSSGAAP